VTITFPCCTLTLALTPGTRYAEQRRQNRNRKSAGMRTRWRIPIRRASATYRFERAGSVPDASSARAKRRSIRSFAILFASGVRELPRRVVFAMSVPGRKDPYAPPFDIKPPFAEEGGGRRQGLVFFDKDAFCEAILVVALEHRDA